MEQYTETTELEQMRSQLTVLKQKLSQQQIVNEQLMRSAMQQKMSWVSKYVVGEIVVMPFVLVFLWWLFIAMGFSCWLCIAWTVLSVASVATDWVVSRTDPKDFLKENLAATARKLIRMKTLSRRWEMFALPAAVVLVAWTCIECVHDGMSAFAQSLVIGSLIGGTVGGILGFSVYRKFQKTNDEIVRQIKDLTAAE